MKKFAILLTIMIAVSSLFGVWSVGQEITDNYSWTTGGTEYNLFDLIDSGKVVVIFWGDSG